MTSSFSLHKIINENLLIGSNNADWLRNMRIRFIQEKIFDILDIPDPGSISDKKIMDVLTDITYCGKLGY